MKLRLINGQWLHDDGTPQTKAERARDSERLKDMLLSRTAPRCSTDTSFFAGVGTLKDQIRDKRQRQQLRANARRMGINLTGNELYQAGLARFPMDPRACIPFSGGKGRIRQMCEEYGAGAEGSVSVKRREGPPPKPKHKLHPRIVKEELRNRIKANPDLAHQDKRELAAQIVHEHGPR